MKKFLILIFIITSFTPSLFAHGTHGTGFMAGLTHPIFGLDHLLAILATPILAYSLLKEKQWIPSLVFIIAMLIGTVMGIKAEGFGMTEWVIALSVVTMGALLATNASLSVVLLGFLSAFFGFFHGHAHGVEMPDTSNIPLFLVGIIVGVSLISALGWGVAKGLQKPLYLRLLGALIAGMGLMMLMG